MKIHNNMMSVILFYTPGQIHTYQNQKGKLRTQYIKQPQ